MEDRAAELAAEYDSISIQVVDEEEMIEKGMGLIYGVGKAAPSGPRIVYLSYKGDPESSDTLALVGKGLCYDTGGLNLKGSGNIETMYTDKHGACTVFGTMKSLAALAPKCNVLGVMVRAEFNARSPPECVSQQNCAPAFVAIEGVGGERDRGGCTAPIRHRHKLQGSYCPY